MMIERLNGRMSVLIAAAGLLLVVLVGWLGFVSPQHSKAGELAVEITDSQAKLAETQALLEGPLLRQSTAELATLQTAIPDEIRMSEILRQLSLASRGSHVHMLGVTPQAVTNTGVANSVPMTLAIEGRYFAIRKFLRLLRSRADIQADKPHATGRLFAIDAIEFAAGSGAGKSTIQATLSVTAFAFSQPVALTGATPEGTLPGGGAAAPTSDESSR